MRDFIIVTVKGEKPSFNYDMELPTHVPVRTLTGHIAEALITYRPSLKSRLSASSLTCDRLKCRLAPDKTLAELGVWSGDILLLK